MERTQLFDLMGELKLYGMKDAFDEIMATAVKRQHEPQRIIGDLLNAEINEKRARSIKYRLAIAKLPLAAALRGPALLVVQPGPTRYAGESSSRRFYDAGNGTTQASARGFRMHRANQSIRSIRERDGRSVGCIRPRVVTLGIKGWNDIHQSQSVSPQDQALKVPLHANPMGDSTGTWDLRHSLLLEDNATVRRISNIFISFVVADAEAGGHGVDFQVLIGDVSKIAHVHINVVSDQPDLNFDAQTDVRN